MGVVEGPEWHLACGLLGRSICQDVVSDDVGRVVSA